MSTLVIVEHNNQKMHPVTRHVLSAAKQCGGQIVCLIAGFNCQAVVEEVSTIEGVNTIFNADHANYEHQMAENLSSLIVALAEPFQSILVSSSTFGKNLLPRVAALLDVTQVSDVVHFVDAKTVDHTIYAGNAIETVKVLDNKMLLTIRATAFDPVNGSQPACGIEKIETNIALEKSKFIRSELNQSSRPELTQAKIIVSGGRGLQNQQNFQLIDQLADVLGAAVGASRAAVDAGFVPNDYQVGQTGKVVAPLLYIAIGISGAVQHLAGMKDSKIIVAINKDEDAPIMQIATYALVGDLFDILPKLIEQLKGHK